MADRNENEEFSDDEDDSDSGARYEILTEDDIEGQEAGIVTNDGNVQITPFNMVEEMEEGHFDSEGMYHWNKEDNIRDNWLDNIDWIKIKENSADTNKQESDPEDDAEFDEIKLYKQMLEYIKNDETVAKALRRLGGSKSISASERLKRKKAGLSFSNDTTENKEALIKLTELADTILTRTGNMDIYQETYEYIFNKVKKHTNKKKKFNLYSTAENDLDMYADDFSEKEKTGLDIASTSKQNLETENENENTEKDIKWELKKDLNSEAIEGPYSTEQMNKFMHENHFKQPVWVRKVGSGNDFNSSRRIDFELYL